MNRREAVILFASSTNIELGQDGEYPAENIDDLLEDKSLEPIIDMILALATADPDLPVTVFCGSHRDNLNSPIISDQPGGTYQNLGAAARELFEFALKDSWRPNDVIIITRPHIKDVNQKVVYILPDTIQT